MSYSVLETHVSHHSLFILPSELTVAFSAFVAHQILRDGDHLTLDQLIVGFSPKFSCVSFRQVAENFIDVHKSRVLAVFKQALENVVSMVVFQMSFHVPDIFIA